MSSSGRGRGRPPNPIRPSQRPGQPAPRPGAGMSSASPAPGGSSSASPSTRPPTTTHSLLPSRSASVSRQGQARMVFRPKLPPRRPVSVKPDPDAPSPAGSPAPGGGSASPASMSPAPSAGPGRPPFTGARRPPRPPRQPQEMVASGPFAQGSGAMSRRDHSRNAQIGGPSGTGLRRPGPSMDFDEDNRTNARFDYREPDRAAKKDHEEYSDPEDDAVEIIDLEDVGQLDEYAPKTLPRMKKEEERKAERKLQSSRQMSKSASRSESDPASRATSLSTVDKEAEATNEADALNLSESEEEEVMDDLLDDFYCEEEGLGVNPEDRMYLFQFPPLFPHFTRPASPAAIHEGTSKPRRSVAFAEDTVGGAGTTGKSPPSTSAADGQKEKLKSTVKTEEERKTSIHISDDDDKKRSGGAASSLEGQVGRLDVYRDGRVLFKFGNDLVMEITGGSQASFLQQVVLLDPHDGKRATTLGEVERKFVVAPEITSMLADAERAHDRQDVDVQDDPEKMEAIDVARR